MAPGAWRSVIRPALSDREGWAVFIGTPKGRNEFHEICSLAERDPKWFSLTLRADQSKLLPESEVADAQAQMTPEQYAQEYLCSFDAAILGAYYGKIIAEIEPYWTSNNPNSPLKKKDTKTSSRGAGPSSHSLLRELNAKAARRKSRKKAPTLEKARLRVPPIDRVSRLSAFGDQSTISRCGNAI